MTAAEVSRESIFLQQNGQYLFVSDELLERLGGELLGRCVHTVDDEQYGYRVVRDVVPLVRHPGRWRKPNAGLFSAIQWRAQQLGIRVHRLISPPISPLQPPIAHGSIRNPALLRFVHELPLGMIVLMPNTKPEHVIADLALGFPNTKIIVFGNRVRQLKRIAEQLRAEKIKAVSASCQESLFLPEVTDTNGLPQVIVTTPSEAGNLDLATSDIVVVMDAYKVGQDRMQLALSQMDARFRLFGISESDRHPAPSEIDAAFTVFGPERIELGTPEFSRRETHVSWVATPPPSSSVTSTDIQFAKRCYWRHERRNRRICQLASALRAGRMIDPVRFRDISMVYGPGEFSPPSVTILVDRPLHAAALSDRLPEWPVIINDAALEGLKGSFRNRVRRLRKQWSGGEFQIVLADSVGQFRGEVSDVILWTGGGTSIDAIPRAWQTSWRASERPLLIVDFLDAHNVDARRLAGQRRRAYWHRDIYPVGVSSAQGRLAMFLNRQGLGDPR